MIMNFEMTMQEMATLEALLRKQCQQRGLDEKNVKLLIELTLDVKISFRGVEDEVRFGRDMQAEIRKGQQLLILSRSSREL